MIEKPGDAVDPEVQKLAQALMFALMTGGSQPYPVPAFEVTKMAELAYQCGVRQTDEKSSEIELPNWVLHGMREQSQEVPPEPDVVGQQETDRVCCMPKPPADVEAHGVVVSGGEL